MKKIIPAGLIAGAIMLAAGMFTGFVFQLAVPSIRNEYQNANLFRPWSDPLMSLYFIHPFLVGVIMAWLWSKTKDLIQGTTPGQKGMRFGMIYFLISVPGMLISYSSFPISIALTLSWTFAILVQGLCSGFLFSRMLR
ncbi:MAG TPA: hypothetical protein VI757_05460 [Bacteroidia bacterium]|nr:hypothetical protein [Bacteroidia bacterium]